MISESSLWHTDADGVDPSIIKDMIYENTITSAFINQQNKNFVVASKGIGKTLLLKYKRYTIENQGNKDGGIFIPESSPYLDFIGDLGTLSKAHKKLLSDLHTSRRIWAISIFISSLSYYSNITENVFYEYGDELKIISKKYNSKYDLFVNWCKGSRKVEPCYVFQRIINMTYGDIKCFTDEYYYLIEDLFKKIHTGIYIFIDRLDQSLKEQGKEVWITCQAGLIEACWDTMRTNNHIKIYSSIRQEAYLCYNSSDKEAITANISFVRYNHEDLLNLTNKQYKFYEEGKDLFSFIGFNEVNNTFSDTSENAFRYIQRHTLGRPRDIIAISSSLSAYNNNITEKVFRRVVNRTSNIIISRNIFDEVRFLFHSLIDEKKQADFLSLIPKNVLTYEEMKNICREFNKIHSCSESFCKKCECLHVFCDLYNSGLLGIVKPDECDNNPTNVSRQKFLGPYDIRNFNKGSLLTNNNYYLIHPALQHYIEELRNEEWDKKYDLIPHVLVGHNYQWTDRCSYLTQSFNIIKTIKDLNLKNELLETIALVISQKPASDEKESLIDKTKERVSSCYNSTERAMKVISLIEKIFRYGEKIIN